MESTSLGEEVEESSFPFHMESKLEEVAVEWE